MNRAGSNMTPERWQQVKEVLHGALELAPEQRAGFLDQACSEDQPLRSDVESLLASSDEARSRFLQSTAARVTLTKGTRLGAYEVQSQIGAGGMGEVYRARDRSVESSQHSGSISDGHLRRSALSGFGAAGRAHCSRVSAARTAAHMQGD